MIAQDPVGGRAGDPGLERPDQRLAGRPAARRAERRRPAATTAPRAQLQGQGFAVARRDVDSSQPKDTVIDQQPKRRLRASRGGTVTLYVSKGPKESTIPDVTSQDEASATQTLEQCRLLASTCRSRTRPTRTRTASCSPRTRPAAPKPRPGTTVTIVVGPARAGALRRGSASQCSWAGARASTTSRSPRLARCSRRSTRRATRR